MDLKYVIRTKGEGGDGLASMQPSRDEAAEFWAELTGVELPRVLDLMGDREREQEGDSHAHPARRVYTLEAPGGGFPQLMWSADLSGAGLTLIPVEEHRAAALDRDTEPA